MTLFLVILALLGLAISLYLLLKKLKNEKVVCFLGHDCDNVVKSKYGKTFGIFNEVPGLLFYLAVFGGVLLNFISLLRIAAVLAVLASLYLVGIQAFSLKMWCEYCIASALINGLILLLLFL